MRISLVRHNNRKKAFEVTVANRRLPFPYSKVDPVPGADDPISSYLVDKELAGEAFTYTLKSGKSGTVHVEQVLDYNRDPSYVRDALLYKLTIEAQRLVEDSALSKREIVRRLGTSAAQFYRLLDQTNYRKSVDQLLTLLQVLDCEVDLVVSVRNAGQSFSSAVASRPKLDRQSVDPVRSR